MNFNDRFIRSQLQLTKPLTDDASMENVRSLQDKIGKLMHFARRHDVVVNDSIYKDILCSLVIPRDEVRGGVIFYVHGGGYTCGNMDYAKGFASVIAAECGMRTVCVEYRLAPEHPYPAALNDVYAAYCDLIEHGIPANKIILAGESAGGGLIYALCLRLRDKGKDMPAGIIAISPWCDLTLRGASYTANKEVDPSLTRERLVFFADCYVGEYRDAEKIKKIACKESISDVSERENPYVSPVYADLTGLPPSIIFAGEDEILLSDAERMRDRLTQYGCEVECYTKPKMWHAYLLYPMQCCAEDFAKINKFVKKCLPKGNERKLRWMHLDNAAKIYPAAATSRWNNIYRLSATLGEEVDVNILQSSLDVTVRRFPSIAVRLKRGVFWYFLEEIKHAPKIQKEKSYPLVRMPFDDIRHCAFRVLVYGKRIAVEFFHALTDGNGALVFLKTLLAEYLQEKYGKVIPNECGVLDRLEEPKNEELIDCFSKHKAKVGKSRRESNSYRIYGTEEDDDFTHVTTFMMDAKDMLELAHKNGVTLTAALAAAFIKASINLQQEDVGRRKRMKKVKVLIPVDLRRIYGESTLRNFVLYTTPGVDPRLGEYTYEEICKIVHQKMCLDITPKNMSARIFTNVKHEERLILKLTPLFLKNIVMRAVFLMFGEKKSTLTMSNLGAVKLPDPMNDYVERLDFVLSAQSNAPYNASIISYKDKLNLNIIRNIKEARLEYAFYNVMKECGIHVKVESNSR